MSDIQAIKDAYQDSYVEEETYGLANYKALGKAIRENELPLEEVLYFVTKDMGLPYNNQIHVALTEDIAKKRLGCGIYNLSCPRPIKGSDCAGLLEEQCLPPDCQWIVPTKPGKKTGLVKRPYCTKARVSSAQLGFATKATGKRANQPLAKKTVSVKQTIAKQPTAKKPAVERPSFLSQLAQRIEDVSGLDVAPNYEPQQKPKLPPKPPKPTQTKPVPAPRARPAPGPLLALPEAEPSAPLSSRRRRSGRSNVQTDVDVDELFAGLV